MSTFALSIPAGSSLIPQGTPGVSPDHQRLRNMLQETFQRLLDTVTLGKPVQDTYKQLYEVLKECSSRDWDGYGAEAVNFESYENAKRFVQGIPFGIRMPEVSAEPDGEITFEWYSAPTRVFSVSIGANNELNYAGLFGAGRAYGTEIFHDEIPEVILSHINRAI